MRGYRTQKLMGKGNEQLKESGINRLKGSIQPIILILFFLSGACGLIYEVVWLRMLTLMLGATAFATSTVLASFMAGLALGSFYFGRFIDRRRDPLKVYALLEAGIGIYALLVPLIFSGLINIYVSIYQHFHISYYLFSLLQFILSFLVLLIPATLMGGTLPVISRFFVKRLKRLGWNVGSLYSMNTLGAVVGCFSAGFFLIAVFGVKEAAYIAALINLLIAGTVLALNRGLRLSEIEDENPEKGKKERKEAKEVYSPKIGRLVLWAFALSGFCALAYEVLWTRALVFFLGNTTYAFTTMLTTFLCGLALGSFVIARFTDTRRKLLALFGLIEILIGLFAILSIPLFGKVDSVNESIASILFAEITWWRWTGLAFIGSFLIMLVPTFLMGATFPLVSKMYTRSLRILGKAIGNVYSVNTIGAVFGSFIAGFMLIPLIGIQKSIILIASINTVIGVIIILSEPLMKYRHKLGMIIGFGLSFVAMGVSFLSFGQFAFTSVNEEASEVLYYKEGAAATVKVYRDELGDKNLSIDGFPVAGTSLGLHDIQKTLAHLPLLLSNVPSPRVLIIGFGAGGTSWGVTQHTVKEVDCVELVPGVVEAAGYFPEINHNVLNDPKFNLIMGDGRNYVLVTDKKYDVISVDATSPKCAGNGSLYALEFYKLCKKTLSKDGLIVQWLPFHLLSDEEITTITKTFKTVFPHTTLWFTPYKWYCILVGTQEELEINFASLSDKLEMKNVKQDLEQLNVTDPFAFLDCFVMDEEAVTEYVGDAKINTDDHPYVEFFGPRGFYTMYTMEECIIQNISSISKFRGSAFPLLTNIGETDEEIITVREKLERWFEATGHSISGQLLAYKGMPERAIVEYGKTLLINPEDKVTKHLIEDTKSKLKRRYLGLGLIYNTKGMYDEAISEFRKVIDIDPNCAEAHNGLGIVYNNKNMFDEAISEFKRAIDINPDFAEAYDNLAAAYNNKGMYDKAISELKKAIEIDPNFVAAHYHLAMLYINKEMYKEAKVELMRVLELNPQVEGARSALKRLAELGY